MDARQETRQIIFADRLRSLTFQGPASPKAEMPQNDAMKGNSADSELCREERTRDKAATRLAPGLASLKWSPGPLGRAVSIGSRLDVEASNSDHAELIPIANTKLYHRRWAMLFLFSAISASNAFMWLQYGIISNIFMRFYNIDSLAIDWLAMIYLLTYIPLILPVLWLLEKRGIREVVLVGSAFNCIGAWIKIGSAGPNLFPVTFLGQFVCSIATVFVLGIPSYLASVWFGEKEVSTACSIGVWGNQVCVEKLVSHNFMSISVSVQQGINKLNAVRAVQSPTEYQSHIGVLVS